MRHIDLFSGIGGFALAVEEVWPDSEHIFCDNDPYCRQLLKLRFPNSKIYGDIKQIKFITNADWVGSQEQGEEQQTSRNRQFSESSPERIFGEGYDSHSDGERRTRKKKINSAKTGKQAFHDLEGCVDLVTGGFPCQPFSQAGKRRGTSDDRYLWPEMLRVIKLARPRWVIAENVRGLLTMQNGLVFEQVCTDLEDSGYEVQPLVIPAVAVNAPHRRDRVWFIAHSLGDPTDRKKKSGKLSEAPGKQEQDGTKYSSTGQSLRATLGWRSKRLTEDLTVAKTFGNAESSRQPSGDEGSRKAQHGRAGARSSQRLTPDSESERDRGVAGEEYGIKKRQMEQNESKRGEVWSEGKRRIGDTPYATRRQSGKQTQSKRWKNFERGSWERNWLEAAAELCRVDDGLPAILDGFELSKSRHRIERLKALGNAIVPQVAIKIMKAIKEAEKRLGRASGRNPNGVLAANASPEVDRRSRKNKEKLKKK